MRVFLSAGEASGDAYGAAFVREMRRLHPDGLEYEGIGGRRMREEGVQLHADTGTWGAISIVQSLQIVPRLAGSYLRAKRLLAQGPPGLFVPIDFGYANIRFARHAKRHGWKVLYFVPPGSWRRDRQGKDLPEITDAISTPFEWSAQMLREMGANAHWFGHPIKQLLRDAGSTNVARGETIGVLPGSRGHEIKEILPLIAEVLQRPEFAHTPAEFALAPSVDLDAFRARWQSLAPLRKDDRLTPSDTYGVLRRARAALVCSGTATLEAALCGCPMVVVYRLSRAVEVEAQLLRYKRPKYIALPNILLDRPAVPELVQEEATPDAVAAAFRSLLEDGPTRTAQLSTFEELSEILGPDDAITQTASLGTTLL